jgi:hypothetical protein
LRFFLFFSGFAAAAAAAAAADGFFALISERSCANTPGGSSILGGIGRTTNTADEIMRTLRIF